VYGLKVVKSCSYRALPVHLLDTFAAGCIV